VKIFCVDRIIRVYIHSYITLEGRVRGLEGYCESWFCRGARWRRRALRDLSSAAAAERQCERGPSTSQMGIFTRAPHLSGCFLLLAAAALASGTSQVSIIILGIYFLDQILRQV